MANIFDDLVQQLADAGIESPRLEARMLLAFVCGKEPAEIFTDDKLNETQEKKLQSLLARRLAHEPLDKILGKREFYKAEFKVSDKVLSPRPDTETLVEAALRLLPSDNPTTILDLGTGSGCIIESLLLERPSAQGVAIDISPEALQIAADNAVNLGVANRLKFIQASWFEADFATRLAQKFDLIVTNPPYIPTKDIATLMPEVQKYDPLLALDGGTDGFDSYKRIAELAPILLKDGGYILLEAGIGQAEQIAEIFAKQGLHLISTEKDLSGIKRCVVMRK
jgi:release factor glutamine methyltransferase